MSGTVALMAPGLPVALVTPTSQVGGYKTWKALWLRWGYLRTGGWAMLPSYFQIEPRHGGKSFNLRGLLEFIHGASLENSLRPNFSLLSNVE